MDSIFKLLILLMVNILINICEADDSLIVQTKSGSIQGFTTHTYSGQEITSFYGVPYAEPPTGELRFQPPKEVVPWTDVYQADKKPCPCYQHILPAMEETLVEAKMMIDRPWCEDCLKMNIWVPKEAHDKVPVMIFFHGGGFSMGSSIHLISEGHTLAQHENIIVISANYRLGVLGFLMLPDYRTPGNVGLLDQQLVLKWVHDNIEAFGGDVSRITIYGESAGSASIGFHLLSPGSSGLFNRAILLSGTPLSPWAFREPEDAFKTALAHAEAVHCHNANVSKSIDCLQALSLEEVGNIGEKYLLFSPKNVFGPSADSHFLLEHPEVSVEAGRFNEADVIIGTTADEGAFFSRFLSKGLAGDEGSLNLETFERAVRRAFPESNDYEIEGIKTFYIDWSREEDPHMFRDQFSKLLGDVLFFCDTNYFSDHLFDSGHTVYRYVFDQKFPGSLTGNWSGAEHGSDMALFHGLLTSKPGPGAELSRAMMKLLGNFARTGNPNPASPTWPKYTYAKRQYLNLALNMTIRANQRVQECAFWEHVMPLLHEMKDR